MSLNAQILEEVAGKEEDRHSEGLTAYGGHYVHYLFAYGKEHIAEHVYIIQHDVL